jgi:DNA topoisomerase VI subunit A
MVKHQSPAEALTALVEGATAKWAKQRRAEERDAHARERRNDRLLYFRRPLNLREAAWRVLPQAYAAASGDVGLANARQIYYAARPEILRITGKDSLDSQYFCQTLLVDYMREHGVECSGWDVVWDDRGHFKEPHRGKTFGLGTLNVRDYLQGNVRPVMEEAGFKDAEIKTHGPDGRFGAVLFIEKEGFAPIFEAANLAEKFDIAIMSSKGMSVTAARMLVDRMCAKCDIPLLTLHDFDIAGFSIGKTVGSDTRRYSFRNRIRVVDLGLRLAGVRTLDLESEVVSLGNVEPSKLRDRLRRNGASAEEIDFLMSGRRVELNAMTSDRLIEFVERKLTEHGITKFVPVKVRLDEAFRLFARSKLIKEAVEKVIKVMPADTIAVPDDLEARVRDYLAQEPEAPWEDAVRNAVESD